VNGLPTQVVTRQLQVKRRTGKVSWRTVLHNQPCQKGTRAKYKGLLTHVMRP